MIDNIDVLRRSVSKELDQGKRSELGQFMTPSVIAQFMASMFGRLNAKIELLDAGAGIGSLTMAFFNRIRSENGKNGLHVNSTCYEIDKTCSGYLLGNLSQLKDELHDENGIELSFQVKEVDFISDSVEEIGKNNAGSYSHAILNPPYKKIHSSSAHRKSLREVNFETVNLYSAFVGLALMRMKIDGEVVAIIPRSFCNGNYYKAFRSLIINNASIKRIHIFEKRTTAFSDDEVLQENVIIHLIKGGIQGKVMVTKSDSNAFDNLDSSEYDFSEIVHPDDKELFIHIPTEADALKQSDNIVFSLKDLGVGVSTGPVVDFRCKEHLRTEYEDGCVPLLYPLHFGQKEIEWPKSGKKPNAIMLNEDTKKMMFPIGYYVVIRRFSSKEEKQRIVARVVNPAQLDFQEIGLENHLNVLHFERKGLSAELAYGLAAYLNSSFVDTSFRSFNGHTQVNATDLKQMKFPDLEAVKHLGCWAQTLQTFDQSIIDVKIAEIL